jgi:DNA-binding CsgD family transcriptional regulator/tetratricopeptide (TPR) repeat protein
VHTALATALEAGLEAGGPPASRATRLAHHWAAAGDQPRALSASIAAAAAAERVYAFAEAQLQLERVLALWDRVPDAAEYAGMDRVALLARCAEAAYAAGDPARAAELGRQALGLVDAARQPRRAGLLHEQLARRLRTLGDPAALDAQQQAVWLVPPEPSVELARVLGSLAQLLVLVSRFEEARGLAEEAVAVAGQVGARAEEADARTALGGALTYLGEPDAGLAELETAVHLATQAGDLIVMLRAILLPLARAALEVGLGDLDAAQARLQAARRLLPAPILEAKRAGQLLAGLAELAWWRGDLDQARQLVAEGVPQVAANPRHAAPLYALRLRVEADRAELARARHPGQPASDDDTTAALWRGSPRPPRARPPPACRSWPPATATPPPRCWAAPRRSPAASAPARSTPRSRPWAGAAAPAAAAPTPAAELGLTPREAEVLALVAAGRSNRQIAQALFISPKTAGVHMSNILAKLGVAGRVEAATVAHRLGLD